MISGAADNDPAGIATYTQVGAQFGYDQLWTALFALPLLTAVQEACARIGLVTGEGLAAAIHQHYGRVTLFIAVFVLVVANTINIGADIGAMTAAARLLIPAPFVVLMVALVALILVLEIFSSYAAYARALKWLALAQLAYLATPLLIRERWDQIAVATFTPHIEWSFSFLLLIVGNIGTTIAPYLFFWEASQEAEEDHVHHRVHRGRAVSVSRALIQKMRIDNAIGMFGSQFVTWSIIVTSATVLHAHGVTHVKTAADAAQALEPLVSGFPYAGFLAKLLFAVGLVSAGLLVIPVLSGSASYALCEAVGWRAGLNLKLNRAHAFYGVITAATLIGLAVNLVHVDLIPLLVWTSVLNGLASVPLLFIIGRIAANRWIMGEHVSGRLSQVLIWLAFLTMVFVAGSAASTGGLLDSFGSAREVGGLEKRH